LKKYDIQDFRLSYDLAVGKFSKRFFDELAEKHFDRETLGIASPGRSIPRVRSSTSEPAAGTSPGSFATPVLKTFTG
jgi:hypothetical protein